MDKTISTAKEFTFEAIMMVATGVVVPYFDDSGARVAGDNAAAEASNLVEYMAGSLEIPFPDMLARAGVELRNQYNLPDVNMAQMQALFKSGNAGQQFVQWKSEYAQRLPVQKIDRYAS